MPTRPVMPTRLVPFYVLLSVALIASISLSPLQVSANDADTRSNELAPTPDPISDHMPASDAVLEPKPEPEPEQEPEPGPRRLTLVSWGGRYADAQKAALIDPWARKQDKIELRKFKGSLESLGRVSAKWDLVDLEAPELEKACSSGLVQTLDTDRLALKPGDLIPGAVHRCGIATQAWSWGFFGPLVKGSPIGVDAIFDPELMPGKRGFYRQAEGLFELVLMAKGTEPKNVYKELSTPRGLNRVFNALAKVKLETDWYYTAAELRRAVSNGSIDMAFGYTADIIRASEAREGQTLKLARSAVLYGLDYWALAKSSDNEEAAYAFLGQAIQPESGVAFAGKLAYLPVSTKAFAALDQLPNVPLADSVLVFDSSWWQAKAGRDVKQAFDTWLK